MKRWAMCSDEEPTPAASVANALSEDINTPRAMAEMADWRAPQTRLQVNPHVKRQK